MLRHEGSIPSPALPGRVMVTCHSHKVVLQVRLLAGLLFGRWLNGEATSCNLVKMSVRSRPYRLILEL